MDKIYLVETQFADSFETTTERTACTTLDRAKEVYYQQKEKVVKFADVRRFDTTELVEVNETFSFEAFNTGYYSESRATVAIIEVKVTE